MRARRCYQPWKVVAFNLMEPQGVHEATTNILSLFVLRQRENRMTGYSPSKMFFERHLRQAADWRIDAQNKDEDFNMVVAENEQE
ncbi:hypothetical protein J6590_076137 [Homalodisca vitripennis]|nr:hypothetical protein J6590_076137 [Homalodisca vitripennis]